MRRLPLLLALLGALAVAVPTPVAAKPLQFTNGITLTRNCVSSGPSTAATLGEGDAGCYLVTCAGETCTVCQNQTVCDLSEAKDGVSIPAGGGIFLRSIGPVAVSFYSPTAAGVVRLAPVVCQ